jgi:hypothetical protein
MGSWGPGVYENDHALDLSSIEVKRLAAQIEEVLASDPIAFDDIEGPLLYVHMLSLLAQEHELPGLKRSTVEAWKKKYLDVFNATIDAPEVGYVIQRRDVITREFDSLAGRLK